MVSKSLEALLEVSGMHRASVDLSLANYICIQVNDDQRKTAYNDVSRESLPNFRFQHMASPGLMGLSAEP